MNNLKNKINRVTKIDIEIEKLKNEREDIKKTIRNEAMALIKEISQYENIEHISEMRFIHLDNDYILYRASIYDGRDMYNQDLYEEFEYELPTEILHNEEDKKNYINKLILIQNEERKLKKEESEKKKEIDLLKKKKEYQELKKIFEK